MLQVSLIKYISYNPWAYWSLTLDCKIVVITNHQDKALKTANHSTAGHTLLMKKSLTRQHGGAAGEQC